VPDETFGSHGDPLDEGRPQNGANGVRPPGMTAHSVPFGELSEPVDLVAVQADDELINALAGGMTVSTPGVSGYDADDRVAAILAAWKADVDAEPIPELVDVDTAVATVVAARPRSSRARYLAPVAAAAAFLVVAIGGVSVTSYNAQPDDVLWGVSKVLYSERAESVEAAERVEERIAAAKEALVAGQPVRAAQELADAQEDLEVVRPQEGQGELAETRDFLEAKAAETPQGQSADPGSPLSTQPSRPVPPGARDPQPSDSDTASTSPAESSTSTPRSEAGSGPEVASTPGSGGGSTTSPDSSTGPSTDPRRAQVAPESEGSTGGSPGSPSTGPETGGNGSGNTSGEGRPDERGNSTEPSATSEGRPDPTTAPTPPPSPEGGGEATGSPGPTGTVDAPPRTSG
jgi:hypothetical protein